MEISAKLVKELRDRTDAGIMECKGALKECNGDIEASIEYLRKKGLSKAAKKADRIASEGAINLKIASDFSKACIIELNSETDFVAKNDGFIELVEVATNLAYENNINEIEHLESLSTNGVSFKEFLQQKIATIGENIVVRRVQTINAQEDEIVNGYLHFNKKIGAVVKIKSQAAKDLKEQAKGVAMQAATMKAQYLNPECVPQSQIDKEKEIAKELLLKEGKNDSIIEKIMPGKIDKFFEEITLVKQKYILDESKLSVEGFLNQSAKAFNTTACVEQFIRFELGEGIEKKVEDFASEVAAQIK